jgi:CubicO group peptidase (beta-lactamase class C family)
METVSPEKIGFSAARLQRIDGAMRRFIANGTIAGAVTLVARQGKIVHFQAAGLVDRDAGRPMAADAIFRIASMTKAVTATAVMLLFEEGLFLLDDPIAEYFPEFAQTKVFVDDTAQGVVVADTEQPITIRHLLTHTSGLTYPFYPDDPVSRIYLREAALRDDESLADNVRRIAALPLAHQPGTRWTYGVSIDVLGRLVEVLASQPFDVFLQQRIFAPLEMTDTGFWVSPHQQDRLAVVYASDGCGGLTRDQEAGDMSQPPAFLSGGGGLVSTASDYARFCQMLLNGGALGNTRLLSRKTVELMTAGHWPGEKGAFPAAWLAPGYSAAFGGAIVADMARVGQPCSVGTYLWAGADSTYFWIDPREQLLGLLMVQVVPMNSRLMDLFQILTYQALIT